MDLFGIAQRGAEPDNGIIGIFLLQPGEGLINSFLAGAQKGHLCAVCEKFLDNCQADASCTAGDDSGFSFQKIHCNSLSFLFFTGGWGL